MSEDIVVTVDRLLAEQRQSGAELLFTGDVVRSLRAHLAVVEAENKRLVTAVNAPNILTCVYCGAAYPPGSPTHGASVLTEHIRVCPKHPLRDAEARCTKAEDAYIVLEDDVCMVAGGQPLHPDEEHDKNLLVIVDILTALRDELSATRIRWQQEMSAADLRTTQAQRDLTALRERHADELARHIKQAQDISLLLADAGVGPCPLPEGVRLMVNDRDGLRERHAAAVKRLEQWAQSNDEERKAGKVPTFLNPHTVLLWMDAARKGVKT